MHAAYPVIGSVGVAACCDMAVSLVEARMGVERAPYMYMRMRILRGGRLVLQRAPAAPEKNRLQKV